MTATGSARESVTLATASCQRRVNRTLSRPPRDTFFSLFPSARLSLPFPLRRSVVSFRRRDPPERGTLFGSDDGDDRSTLKITGRVSEDPGDYPSATRASGETDATRRRVKTRKEIGTVGARATRSDRLHGTGRDGTVWCGMVWCGTGRDGWDGTGQDGTGRDGTEARARKREPKRTGGCKNKEETIQRRSPVHTIARTDTRGRFRESL